MRSILLVALLLCLCEESWGQATQPAANRPASTRPAVLAPSTTPATRPTSRPGEPLSTPDSAVLHMFKLMGENDPIAVRSVLIDPPPLENLRQFVAQISLRLKQGARVELMESKIERNAAAVVYRTIYPDGRVEVAPVILVGRYDRWKIVLGQINPKRYTNAEKQDLVAVSHWLEGRLPELQPATQPAQPVAPAQ